MVQREQFELRSTNDRQNTYCAASWNAYPAKHSCRIQYLHTPLCYWHITSNTSWILIVHLEFVQCTQTYLYLRPTISSLSGPEIYTPQLILDLFLFNSERPSLNDLPEDDRVFQERWERKIAQRLHGLRWHAGEITTHKSRYRGVPSTRTLESVSNDLNLRKNKFCGNRGEVCDH